MIWSSSKKPLSSPSQEAMPERLLKSWVSARSYYIDGGENIRNTKIIVFRAKGTQYACNEFTKILKANKLISQSMSRKGNCWDNAVAESFFKTIEEPERSGARRSQLEKNNYKFETAA